MPDPAEQAFDMTPLAVSIVSASAPLLDDESGTPLDTSVPSVAGLVMHSKAFLTVRQEISVCGQAGVGASRCMVNRELSDRNTPSAAERCQR
jgi:hypothetical protein